jgi:hypothetical protein
MMRDKSRPFEKSGLQFDPHNANKGTERGLGLLEKSVERYGAGRSILATGDDVILAGNKTAQIAAEKGIPFRVVETDGRELIVVKRKDLVASDPRARELAIADNRIAEIDLDWDGAELQVAKADGVDVGAFFFDEELERLMGRADDDGGGSEEGAEGNGGETAVTCPACGHEFRP